MYLGVPRSSSRSSKALRWQLPELEGRAIRVRFLPALSVGSRKLYSERDFGRPVYAATFVRKREIVLDLELAGKPRELSRILTHELFHFVWIRLGNPARRSFGDLLQREWKQRARGELGWSAEWRKAALTRLSQPAAGGRKRWREYVCESFCDTAAWLYSGLRRHPEFTLARRYRAVRAEWFRTVLGRAAIPI